MGDLVVRGGDVLTPAGRVAADVVVRSGRIVEVVERGAGGAAADGELPVLDAAGLLVAPGLIDLQCNGAGGFDLTAAPEQMWEMSALLPQWGVTAWVPTVVTSPDQVRERALRAFQAGPPDDALAAKPLGLHFEGPYLAPDRRGAHASAHLSPPDRRAVAGWSRDAGVALVTLAPELPGALGMLRDLVDRGVVVSLGHSSATAAEATAAVDAGARWVTHLFNAMAPLHHRDPGLAGVALTDDRLLVGAIVDGLHVHPMVVTMAARSLGRRLTLVTDAVAALGMPPGRWALGDVEALADGEGVRLPDGTLAGSLLSLDRAVANLRSFTGTSLDDALHAASTAPARLLGLEGERGVIAPGAVGDFVLLLDAAVPVPPSTAVDAPAAGGPAAADDPAPGPGASAAPDRWPPPETDPLPGPGPGGSAAPGRWPPPTTGPLPAPGSRPGAGPPADVGLRPGPVPGAGLGMAGDGAAGPGLAVVATVIGGVVAHDRRLVGEA
jgi:N-acetylglucosamine-6-phosphate deacetylase